MTFDQLYSLVEEQDKMRRMPGAGGAGYGNLARLGRLAYGAAKHYGPAIKQGVEDTRDYAQMMNNYAKWNALAGDIGKYNTAKYFDPETLDMKNTKGQLQQHAHPNISMALYKAAKLAGQEDALLNKWRASMGHKTKYMPGHADYSRDAYEDARLRANSPEAQAAFDRYWKSAAHWPEKHRPGTLYHKLRQ